jgi:hypothetical protein
MAYTEPSACKASQLHALLHRTQVGHSHAKLPAANHARLHYLRQERPESITTHHYQAAHAAARPTMQPQAAKPFLNNQGHCTDFS